MAKRKRKGVSLSLGRGEKSRKGGLTAKGRAAMIGIVAALLNYAWTGQMIPGIW